MRILLRLPKHIMLWLLTVPLFLGGLLVLTQSPVSLHLLPTHVSMQFGAHYLLLLGLVLGLVAFILGLGWLFACAWHLDREGRLDNRIALLTASGYLMALAVYQLAFPIFTISSWSIPPWATALFGSSATTGFALASYLMLTFKATAALERAESTQLPQLSARFTNWLGFLLYPIGLWWLQPRVSAARKAPRPNFTRLEDHLVD